MDEDNFNAGVLSFDPDQRVYDELMAEHLNSTSYVWHGWAEQGLLNWCACARRPSIYNVDTNVANLGSGQTKDGTTMQLCIDQLRLGQA